MLKQRSYTLVEILIVVVIIGILASLGLPNYNAIKEKSLDKEAKATVSLIQAAEKIYRMEEGSYYPIPPGTVSNIANINSYLRLHLPASATSWVYSVSSSAQEARATRNKTGGRRFTIPFTSDTITCTPNSDTCYP